MRYLFYGGSFFLLLILFVFSTKSIVSARVVDLRFRIQKEQIMNYELSSKTLKEKLRQIFSEKDSFQTEIQLNILESKTLNADMNDWDPSFTLYERSGFFISILFGLLQFKAPQEMSGDASILNKIQAGFNKEKKRNYTGASEIYRELEDDVSSDSEEMAFILLHDGFCLAMSDKRDEAKLKLEKILDSFPGTHYSDNANLLLSLMDSSEKRRQKMQKSVSDESELAGFYYKNGDYSDVIRVLSQKENITLPESFTLNRSREEVGQIPEAIQGYLNLVNQDQNKSIAVHANRRLMLLGNFYIQNESLVKISEQKAKDLGDKESLALVKEGKSRTREVSPSLQEALQEEKGSEREETPEKVWEEKIEVILEKEKTKKAAISIPPGTRIQLQLKDGRVLYPISIQKIEDKLQLEMKNFPLVTPIETLSKVTTTTVEASEKDLLVVKEKGKGKITVSSIRYENGILHWESKERVEKKSTKGKDLEGIYLR